jgi:hypothetical protein
MSEQGFRGVPGVPDGWELVRIGEPKIDEWYLSINGKLYFVEACMPTVLNSIVPVVRKIEKQKRYRQFANAEEFKPFRDRWWRYKSEKFTSRPPRGYDDYGWISGDTWGRLFDAIVFDDGSPFGVEVTE